MEEQKKKPRVKKKISRTTVANPKKPKEKLHSNRIRQILAEIDMCQQELADLALDGNAGYMSRIINGNRRCISLPIAIKIARVLGRPVEEVFIYKFKEDATATTETETQED
jgi:DNA-binding XRE family transcriptional regulator